MSTSCYQFLFEFAGSGFVVSFAEGTFANGGFWFGGKVCAHDSPVSLMSTFCIYSNGGVWNVGTIVEWRWHVFVFLLHMV